MTIDAQYTIGIRYDGKWGLKSQLAAEKYLADLKPDVNAIDEIKAALLEAGVASQIFVDLQ